MCEAIVFDDMKDDMNTRRPTLPDTLVVINMAAGMPYIAADTVQ